MRKLNELYSILWQYCKDRIFHLEGVCNWINAVHLNGTITEAERQRLFGHFERNRPASWQHEEFYTHGTFFQGVWWWSRTPEGLAQRKLFIEKMLLITA